jgi:translation initiation factor 1
MSNIDPITGLPKELSSWENIAKEDQKIVIRGVKKKFGKPYTIIEGIDDKDVNIKDVAKQLKNKFACGGTAKDGNIELQGNHKDKAKEELIKLGFSPESIEVQR